MGKKIISILNQHTCQFHTEEKQEYEPEAFSVGYWAFHIVSQFPGPKNTK